MRFITAILCLALAAPASGAVVMFDHTQRAETVPYDNSGSGLSATNVQQAIDAIYSTFSGLISPGFTWGRSGNIPAGTWLQNDTVPSNITGRNFPFYNGQLVTIAVSNENTTTAVVELYAHDKVTFTLLATLTLSAQKSKEQNYTGVSLTKGKELAVKIGSGSAKNIVVQLVIKGTLTP